MNKYKALYNWFNSFGIPFYVSTNVPDNPIFPYGTYENITSSFGEDSVSITVYLHYYTTREDEINAMSDKMSKVIGYGGTIITCDEGAIWIKKGTPFSQPITTESDKTYKGRYINIELEFLTNY